MALWAKRPTTLPWVVVTQQTGHTQTHAVKHVWKTAFYFLVTDLLTKKKKINNTLQQFLEKLDSSPEVHSSSAHALMSGPASVTGVSICPEPRVDLQNLMNFISCSLRDPNCQVKQRQVYAGHIVISVPTYRMKGFNI